MFKFASTLQIKAEHVLLWVAIQIPVSSPDSYKRIPIKQLKEAGSLPTVTAPRFTLLLLFSVGFIARLTLGNHKTSPSDSPLKRPTCLSDVEKSRLKYSLSSRTEPR